MSRQFYYTIPRSEGSQTNENRESPSSLGNRFDALVNGSNATSQVLESTPGNHESSLLDHPTELLLGGETLNTLNEVLVAVTVRIEGGIVGIPL